MTSISDAQRLLVSVGFPIVVDGAAGPATTQAISWFQESWTRSWLAVDGLWGPATEAAARACVTAGGKVSAHFTLKEFRCPHCHWPRAHRSLVRGLEKYRDAFATGGLTIVSGYRCVAHNAAIHGATGSQHVKGRAADIPPVVSVDAVARLRVFGGLEYQPKVSGRRCTHVDTRASGNPDSPSIFAWG
jgi:zinc D-Ala-D-Ala carboxypeptidase